MQQRFRKLAAALLLLALGGGTIAAFLAVRGRIARRGAGPAQIPNLPLRDRSGARTDLATVAAGRPAVLAFVDSGCSHCRSMAAKLAAALANEPPGACRLLLIVEGEAEVLFGTAPATVRPDDRVRLFLDDGSLRRNLLGLARVPHTLFVDAERRVVRSLPGDRDPAFLAAELGRFCR